MSDTTNDTGTLNYQGHVYVDTGEAPCPIPGGEDGLCHTQTEDGTPAWWDDGHLYVLDESASSDNSGMNNLPSMPGINP